MINEKLAYYSNVAVKLLKEQGLRVSFAESCTGGMATAAITSVDGSSAVLDLSIVTYANSAKTMYTDVTDEVLEEYGAVSEQTAQLMSSGIKKRAMSDIGVGITGIAGPTGGSPQKPVGTVYIAIDSGEFQTVKHFLFSSPPETKNKRQAIRIQTAVQALAMLIDLLKGMV